MYDKKKTDREYYQRNREQILAQHKKAYQAYAETYRIPDLEGEEWKPLVGYEEHYQASNKGRIKSTWLDGYYDGYEIVGLNNDSRTNDFKYLIKGTPVPDKNGVPRFGFFCKGKQVYTRILIRRKQL